MADAPENLPEAKRRRSDEAESRSVRETKKKGDEDERQSSIGSIPSSNKSKEDENFIQETESESSRPEKRDVPEDPSVVAQDLQEQIEKQRKEAPDNLQRQSNDETEGRDQQNVEQQGGVEKKGNEIRFKLDQFYNRKRKKQQEMKSQQQQEIIQEQQQQKSPQEHRPLASHFNFFPLMERLAAAIETGTPDQNSDALVTELNSQFNKSQELLNSIAGSLGSKTMTVDGEKRKLEESEKLLQQRRELIEAYKKSTEDILKIEP